MNHLALGAALPFFAAALIYAWRGWRASFLLLVLTPIAMLACALWAVAPDIPRLTGDHELYSALARDPRTNIFLWHHTIDALESDSSWPVVTLVLMEAALLFAAWRELRMIEQD
ncbi:MAG: hypothetical protein ACUVWX_00140 [Kiritimatiellia bacterium]